MQQKKLIKGFDNDMYEYLNKIIDIKLKELSLKLKNKVPLNELTERLFNCF